MIGKGHVKTVDANVFARMAVSLKCRPAVSSIAGVAIFLFITSATAKSQTVRCGPVALVTKALMNGHSEKAQWVGKTGKKYAVMLYASKKGSWTLLSVRKDTNLACIVGVGKEHKFAERRSDK